ncbi:DGQHR domain-containing protein [Burkholderia multivorans]|uniref:DGQHR domain-containing protein n=1 Tax=Burkholderia multivorans TaxID=87883 RepID=UPI0021C0B559|nr:DGQHR domain-containing protein [Burkholderia multivorans]MDN7867107.1 DGQHR domain-containing protein [Burkholderia multivorans]
MITESEKELVLPCLRLKQPMGEFYVCKISAKDLCDITYFDIRQMLGDREMDTYIGIQRKIDPSRVVGLQSYVNTLDACFPTSIVLSVDEQCAVYNSTEQTLTLKNDPNPEDEGGQTLYRGIAKVIDGQHRIEGLRGLIDGEFELTVSIFVGLDVEDQAYIFSTVNLAQTKVNKSLVYDLFDFSKFRSPQRTCHNIVIALDRREGGPFFRRIKRLGSATAGRHGETLTQATFVEALMPYVSSQPALDRDRIKRNLPLPRAEGVENTKLIFRNLFVDEKDIDIGVILFNYFTAVSLRWPISWNSTERGNILNKTNGFKALMSFLRRVYVSLRHKSTVPSVEMFSEIFDRMDLQDGEFTTDHYPPGTSGESELRKTLLAQSKLDENFSPRQPNLI